MRISISTSCAVALVVALAMMQVLAGQNANGTDVMAAARKAIGGKKLDTLTSLSVQAAVQRNVGNFRVTSDLELLLGLPDKYVRSETSTGGMVVASTMGFNGSRPIRGPAQPGMPPGGMIIRMGGPGPGGVGDGEKLTPEQQQQIDAQVVRSAKYEISRLLLGWFVMVLPSVPAQYTDAGEAESPDGKAFVLDANSADGFAARLFIDEKTHLPLMVTYRAPQPRMVTVGAPGPGQPVRGAGPNQVSASGGEDRERLEAEAKRQLEQPAAMVEHTLYFDDWSEEDGIQFPHSFRRAVAGTTVEEWTIRKVKLNPKIDQKKFESEE